MGPMSTGPFAVMFWPLMTSLNGSALCDPVGADKSGVVGLAAADVFRVGEPVPDGVVADEPVSDLFPEQLAMLAVTITKAEAINTRFFTDKSSLANPRSLRARRKPLPVVLGGI